MINAVLPGKSIPRSPPGEMISDAKKRMIEAAAEASGRTGGAS
jgi:hypothetical protein